MPAGTPRPEEGTRRPGTVTGGCERPDIAASYHTVLHKSTVLLPLCSLCSHSTATFMYPPPQMASCLSLHKHLGLTLAVLTLACITEYGRAFVEQKWGVIYHYLPSNLHAFWPTVSTSYALPGQEDHRRSEILPSAGIKRLLSKSSCQIFED